MVRTPQHHLKMSTLCNLIYKFNAIQIKIPESFFFDIGHKSEAYPKVHKERKVHKNMEENIEMEELCRGTSPDFNVYTKHL